MLTPGRAVLPGDLQVPGGGAEGGRAVLHDRSVRPEQLGRAARAARGRGTHR